MPINLFYAYLDAESIFHIFLFMRLKSEINDAPYFSIIFRNTEIMPIMGKKIIMYKIDVCIINMLSNDRRF